VLWYAYISLLFLSVAILIESITFSFVRIEPSCVIVLVYFLCFRMSHLTDVWDSSVRFHCQGNTIRRVDFINQVWFRLTSGPVGYTSERAVRNAFCYEALWSLILLFGDSKWKINLYTNRDWSPTTLERCLPSTRARSRGTWLSTYTLIFFPCRGTLISLLMSYI
jgi:hypothetical protein